MSRFLDHPPWSFAQAEAATLTKLLLLPFFQLVMTRKKLSKYEKFSWSDNSSNSNNLTKYEKRLQLCAIFCVFLDVVLGGDFVLLFKRHLQLENLSNFGMVFA